MTGVLAVLDGLTRAAARGRALGRGVVAGLAVALVATACGGSGGGGGGGGSSSPTATTPTPTPLANTLPVTVDAGPSALTATGAVAANILYATVTVCTSGTAVCTAVDHVQVDTGSTGLRLIASTLGAVNPTPVTDPSTALPLRECVQFADGYSFGSVGTVDVTIGGRTLAGLPIQVIGDAAAGAAPSSCVSGPEESDVASFGANGILGIGNFLQDCGSACAMRAVAGTYYVCPSSGCTSTIVALARQVPNPVASLSADNNGVVIQLPAVSSPGAATVSGTVRFGINTQSDNALGAATVYKLTSTGTFTATAGGSSYSNSFIDSGSNAYFFPSTGIAVCADADFFYCPVTSSNAPTSVSQTATINGTNGVAATVTFTVDNADQLFNTTYAAFPGLAGPNGSLINGASGGFDFGLPFFYGRSVYVVFEGNTVNGVTGPAIAF